MKTINKLKKKHLTQLHKLYLAEWWTNTRTLEETEIAINNSSIVIGIVDENDDLQAFIRVLTDYVFKATVFDVIVADTARGQGLGHQLMELVATHKDLQKVKHFELYCRPEMADFYLSHGFSYEVGGMSMMRRTTL
ncbi:MAG: GNAT family N-acetyltransferase [Epsilonproteobacteria bacterium]|nr:GNAT family N-acetyltransferase [Campylobacterota bacterium]